MASNAVSIADLENNLSAYLARVRSGEEILIRDDKTLIAKLIRVAGAGEFSSEELALAAAGKVRLPKQSGPLPGSFWKEKVPRVTTNRTLALLREDRDAR